MFRGVAEFLERVAEGELDPVYILSSEQPLLIDRAVSAIVDAAVPPASRGFNYDVIETKGLTVARILAAAQTLPMMAQRRMVLVRDLAPLPAAELAKLIPYLQSPNPSTVLVALSSKVDRKLKFYAEAVKRSVLHVLEAPKQLGAWVKAEAKRQKVPMDADACKRLVDAAGKDLARLSLAIDQLGLYAQGREVTVDDVDDLIADTRERSVFELTEAIGQVNLRGALAAVASLCEQKQSPVGVVVMVARFMRQLGLCHVAAAKRLPRNEIAGMVGIPPYLVPKVMEQSRRFQPDAVLRALTKLSAADRALKGQTDDIKIMGRELGERVILDRVVTDIIRFGRGQG